jgi:hypothetical protein
VKRRLLSLVCWWIESHHAAAGSGRWIDGEFSVVCRRCGRRVDYDGRKWLVREEAR